LELRPSGQTNSFSAIQQVSRINGTEISLPCSKKPRSDPYFEGSELSLRHPILLNINFNISFHLCLGLPSDFLRSGFRYSVVNCIIFFFLFLCVSDALHIVASFVCLPSKYLELHLFIQIEGLIEVTGRGGRRRKQLLNNVKKKEDY